MGNRMATIRPSCANGLSGTFDTRAELNTLDLERRNEGGGRIRVDYATAIAATIVPTRLSE
jgi:hypothetical protein